MHNFNFYQIITNNFLFQQVLYKGNLCFNADKPLRLLLFLLLLFIFKIKTLLVNCKQHTFTIEKKTDIHDIDMQLKFHFSKIDVLVHRDGVHA